MSIMSTIQLLPPKFHYGTLWWATFIDQASFVADAAGEKVAFKYIPTTTSAITAVNLRVSWGSASNDTNFKISMFAHDWASNCPLDSTQLGTSTSGFAGGTTGSVWTGAQTFGTSSGTLVKGDPVWFVIEYESGTALDATHKVTGQTSNTNLARLEPNYSEGLRVYTSSSWTGVNFTGGFSAMVVNHADSTYGGLPHTGAITGSSRTHIYNTSGPSVTNRQGLVYQVPSLHQLVGVHFVTVKAGTPGSLTIEVYEGSTLKDSVVRTQDKIFTVSSGSENIAFFDTPVDLAANTNIYIIFSQGITYPNGDNSNDYNINTMAFDSTTRSAVVPSTWLFCYGTGTDPTAYSTDNAVIPAIIPLVSLAGLKDAAGGGRPEIRGGNL